MNRLLLRPATSLMCQLSRGAVRPLNYPSVALPPTTSTPSGTHHCRQAHLNVINSDEFYIKVMKNKRPVLVNFHAEWCEPCKILTPALREAVKEDDKIDLLIINVDDCPELVHEFEVKAVPAVLCFKDGIVVDKFIGLVDLNVVENVIKKLSELE